MAPERRGVAIVEIDNRTFEILFQARPDVESRPIRMHEIGGIPAY